jgi:hypothetical protein
MPVQEFGVEQRFRYWEQDLENKGEGAQRIDHQGMVVGWIVMQQNNYVKTINRLPSSRATMTFQ